MPTTGGAGGWLCGGPSIKPLTQEIVKGAGVVTETSFPTTKKQGELLGTSR
jgi:hypothetical protein